MKFGFFKTRKAQSATEYLMTYGWAILAIAIVGALLYTQVFSNSQCGEGANGFPMTGSVSPDGNLYSLSASSGDLGIRLTNHVGQDISVTKVKCGSTEITLTAAVAINDGATGEVTASACYADFANVGEGDCYTEDVVVKYTVGGGGTEYSSVGTISGKFA